MCVCVCVCVFVFVTQCAIMWKQISQRNAVFANRFFFFIRQDPHVIDQSCVHVVNTTTVAVDTQTSIRKDTQLLVDTLESQHIKALQFYRFPSPVLPSADHRPLSLEGISCYRDEWCSRTG